MVILPYVLPDCCLSHLSRISPEPRKILSIWSVSHLHQKASILQNDISARLSSLSYFEISPLRSLLNSSPFLAEQARRMTSSSDKSTGKEASSCSFLWFPCRFMYLSSTVLISVSRTSTLHSLTLFPVIVTYFFVTPAM